MTRKAYEKDMDDRTIPVVIGRGKSGEATTGPARFLVDTNSDRDALSRMQTFMARYYDPEMHAEMGSRVEFSHTVTPQVLATLDTESSFHIHESRLMDGVSLYFVNIRRGDIKPYQTENRSHRTLVTKALADGKLSADEAEKLGHFADYPALREKVAPQEGAQVPEYKDALPGQIYQVKVKSGDEIVTKYADPHGGRGGFGDTLHDTYADAEKSREDRLHREAENKAFADKEQAEQAVKDAREAEEKAAREDVDGFDAGMDPLRRGAAIAALNQQFRYGDGRVMSRKEKVRELIAAGEGVSTLEEDKIKPMTRTQFNRADQREQDAHARKVKEGGKQTVYLVGDHVMGKTAYDYAQHLQHLLAKKQAEEVAPAKPEFTKLKTVYGETVHVKTAHLDGERTLLPMFTADGKPKEQVVHRDNLDADGSKRQTQAEEDAENPLFATVLTKEGKAFATESAAQRELNRLGFEDTHEVVGADSVARGSVGFIGRKKAVAEETDALVDAALKQAVAEGAPVEFYQWMRNAEGGQKFGNQQVNLTLTRPLFTAFFAARSFTDFESYIEEHPDSAVALVRKDGAGPWRLTHVESLENLRPSPEDGRWVIKVDDLSSEQAQTFGAQADSDLPPAQDDDPGADEAPRMGILERAEQLGRSAKNVAKLLHQLGLQDEVMQGESFHVRLKNPPYIDLVIERHPAAEADLHNLYLTHYVKMNGDLVHDGEMVFLVGPGGHLKLSETAVQNPIRGGEVRGCDNSFASMFSTNLIDQGFGKAQVVRDPKGPSEGLTDHLEPLPWDLEDPSEPLESPSEGATEKSLRQPNVGEINSFRREFFSRMEHYVSLVDVAQNGTLADYLAKFEATRQEILSDLSADALELGTDPTEMVKLIESIHLPAESLRALQRDEQTQSKPLASPLQGATEPQISPSQAPSEPLEPALVFPAEAGPDYLLASIPHIAIQDGQLAVNGQVLSKEGIGTLEADLNGLYEFGWKLKDQDRSTGEALIARYRKTSDRLKEVMREWEKLHPQAYEEYDTVGILQVEGRPVRMDRSGAAHAVEAGYFPVSSTGYRSMSHGDLTVEGLPAMQEALEKQTKEESKERAAKMRRAKGYIKGKSKGAERLSELQTAFVYAVGSAPFAPEEDRLEFTRMALEAVRAAKALPEPEDLQQRESRAALVAALPMCERAVEKGDFHSLGALVESGPKFRLSVGGGHAFLSLLAKLPDSRQPWELFREEYTNQQMRRINPEGWHIPKLGEPLPNIQMSVFTDMQREHKKLVRKAMEEGLITEHSDYPDLAEDIREDQEIKSSRAPRKPADPKETAPKLNPDHFAISDEITRTAGFSPKIRFEENVAAIRLLQDLEISGRKATPAEKSVLVKYNGWGGLPTLFERYYGGDVAEGADSHSLWVREGRETTLPDLLEKTEYDSARASVNNAHFTTPDVTRAMWGAVRNLGFTGGRVLETSMGAGAFLGTCPEDLVAKSKFVGVEKDEITGRLAKQIYPDADIRVEGLEDAKLPDNFFDLAISNVPFGDYQVFDADYAEHNLLIHDYFILKALDKLKPGGVAALITSSGTMDKLSKKSRRLMAERAELAGAIRLPENAHEAQAGTKVTTDILFFRKRTRPMELGEEPAWVGTSKVEFPDIYDYNPPVPMQVNDYFIANPEHVLGTLGLGRGQQGRRRLTVTETTPRQEALPQLVEKMFPKAVPGEAPVDQLDDLSFEPAVVDVPGRIFDFGQRSEGSFLLHEDGKVYQVVENGASAEQIGLDGKKLERLTGLIGVREALEGVFLLEKASGDDTPELESARKTLNEIYNGFVKTHGPLNDSSNRRVFMEDPEFGRVMALELYDDEKKTAKKADIFFQRVLTTPKDITSVDTPHEAMLVSLNTKGGVHLPFIASLCGQSIAAAAKTLQDSGDIFLDPSGDTWVAANSYLSGNVKVKLKMARAAAAIDPIAYGPNVAALEEIQPVDLTPKDIELRLGSPWVPTEDVKAFVGKVLNIPPYRMDDVSIRYRSLDGQWVVDIPKDRTVGIRSTSTYGTSRRPFHDLLERALNQQTVAVHDKPDPESQPVLNAQETILAQQKLDELQQIFRKFLWEEDEARAERMVRTYNDRYNNYVPPKYDGSFLTFPGMSATIDLRPHQRNAVWRALQEGNTLIAHDVGTGKTMVQIAIAMEMKRLGKSAKPWIIIPNHMLDQFERETRQLYPGAKVLAANINDLSKQNRQRFAGKLVNNDWDVVIMTHSMFGRLGVDPEFEARFINEELVRYRMELDGIDTKNAKDRKRFGVKKIEAKVKSLKAHLQNLQNVDRDNGLFVGDLNLDALLVDESHNYKNLAVDTSANNEVSASIAGSQRAWDMFVKTRFIYAKRGGPSGVCFSSGTPVSNHVMEFYNIQRYLQPQVLDEMGLSSPSAWAGNFLTPKSQWEPAPSGSGWKVRTRYAMHNLPELMQAMRVCMDVVTAEQTGIRRPESERKNVTTAMSRVQRHLMSGLARRVRKIHEGGIDPSDDNLLKIVSEGRKMALDPRLLHPEIPDHPESKVNLCVNDLFQTWQETTDILGTQLVFCDLGTPSGSKGKFNIYDDIRDKLVARGIPRDQIAFIHEYSDDKAKGVFFQAVRDGKIRVVLGSTAKMGEGTNVQDKIVSLTHLDAPWRPKDIEQRDGRAIRQGNTNDKVERRIYTTEDTFDLFMWSTLKIKAETFSRVIRGDSTVRKLDMDIDPTYAETAAITSNDSLIREKLELEQELNRLELLSRSHADNVFRLRRLIRGYQEEIVQLQDWQDRLELVPEPTGVELVWTLDLRPFGFESEFSGDREDLIPVLGKLFKSQQLSEIEGIACCGVPVRVERERVEFKFGEGARNQSTWFVGSGDDPIKRQTAALVEELITSRGGLIRRAAANIVEAGKKMQETEAELNKGFEFDDRLVQCKGRHRELLQEIEAEAKRKQEAGETEDDDFEMSLEELLAEMEEEEMMMRASA